jgi:PucR C-terminal helix-turn-helix domain/GGDEF-like domain
VVGPRGVLAARLHGRRDEILQAALARIPAVAGSADTDDLEYREGIHRAIAAAIDYGLAAVESGNKRIPPIPDQSLAQARLASRRGVGLDVVMRRYLSGYALLTDYIVRELQAERGELLDASQLRRLLRGQATVLDRLLAAVGEQYAWEARMQSKSTEKRRSHLVSRLLGGEPIDTSELAYDFDVHHVGLLAGGARAEETIREVAAALDRRLLLVKHGDDEPIWSWLGSFRPFNDEELDRIAKAASRSTVSLSIGEPGHGPAGWRLSHEQARASWPIAVRSPQRWARYGEVALLASMLRDDVLARSVSAAYLAPLNSERDRGASSRQTLMAYFSCERNASSAAAALGVTRQTVVNRLRTIEERLGRPLSSCAAEIEAALRLETLGYSLLPDGGASIAAN